MNKASVLVRQKYKYFIYLICTVGICWIGVWRDIGNGAQWAFANNLVGFCLFPMLLCRFKVREFIKLPYLLWIICFLVAAYPVYKMLAPGTDYNAQILSAVINVGLYGLIALKLFIHIFIEKAAGFKHLSIAFYMWLGMMVWCSISRNAAIWPLWYLVMFGAYYLAPVSKNELKEMIKGIADGIIISFFWVQIRAFLYRPYDFDERYYGHFTNPNVNGMFYLYSLSGILTRWWISLTSLDKHNLKNRLTEFFYFVLSVSVLDFINYTGAIGAFLAATLMFFAFLLIKAIRDDKRKMFKFLTRGFLIILIFLVLFYPVYACMRYIPALRHHPVWYRDYSEYKVHSWDPIDSCKYISFERALNGCVFSRIIWKFRVFNGTESSAEYQEDDIEMKIASLDLPVSIVRTIMVSNAVVTQDYPGGTWVYEYDDGVEPGTDSDHSALLNYGVNGNFDIRVFIWKYFFERMNLLGHEELNVGVFVGNYWGHAHNAFIQIAYLFGIPAGVFFLMMVGFGIIRSFISLIKSDLKDTVLYIFPLVFFIGYLCYGMCECPALTGEAMFTILFLTVDMASGKA